MSFTVRCGKCHEPISKHIVVRTKTVCPEDHLAKWLDKWGWKFTNRWGELNYEKAQRAWERATARLPHPGVNRGARPPRPGSKRRKMDECGFCGKRMLGGKTDKRYGLLCAKCAHRVEKARERAKSGRFSDRDPKEKYYVTVRFIHKGEPRQLIFVIPANDSADARKFSRFKLPKGAIWIGATATKMVQRDPHTRNTTHPYPYGIYYRWAGKDWNDGHRHLGRKWRFLTSAKNIAEAQKKVRELKSEGLEAKWSRFEHGLVHTKKHGIIDATGKKIRRW